MRSLPRRALWLLLAFAACGAQAHKASDAYVTLHVATDGRVERRVDVALRDLDRDLDLDTDRNGALTWREVRTRWDAFERLVDQAVPIAADGRPCTPVAGGPPRLDTHVDGRYAVLARTLDCGPAPKALTLGYRLFERSDPTHRGIARVDAGAGTAPATLVLVPGDPPSKVALGGGRPARPTVTFFMEGLHHIAIGADHVLFLVTLLMVAVWRRQGAGWTPRESARSAWREALRLVTAFTVAHSLTLGLSAMGVLAPSTRWVESLIAVSVLVAALDNLRPFLPGPRWISVAVFGLVHGFGFAGPLQALGLRRGELVLPLLGFNLGVEAGQLVLVGLLLPLALALRRAEGYRQWIVRPASAAVALVALGWTLERSLALSLPTF